MSGSLLANGALAALRFTANIYFRTARGIGNIIPEVVVEENHRDILAVTDHPVEKGSPITDHSYREPLEVTIRGGVSNFLSFTNRSNDAYVQLQQLQISRTPFSIYTGKRVYTNMLMVALQVNTTAETENALMFVAHFRQIRIVNTRTTTLPTKAQQKVPEKTGSTSLQGAKAPQPVAPSSYQNVLRNNPFAV